MHTVTLIPGDGIGPEVTAAACEVIAAAGVAINWERVTAGAAAIDEFGTPLPQPVLASIAKNKVALKGPLTTPVAGGFPSVNVSLRKKLDLYCNLRPVQSLAGIKTRYENIDLVIIRENTEGLYGGAEFPVGPDGAVASRSITRAASRRIAEFAFEYAVQRGRKKITAVHKANILKKTDGLFLACCREVARAYPDIAYGEMIVDNLCLQLVQDPHQFDVLVLPNLYGDIVSDLCSGFVGGLGLVPGANIGRECSIFEAVHGSAPDLAGKNQANPTALILSAALMLEQLGEKEAAGRIRQAVERVLKEGTRLTPDLGGRATTAQYTEALCKALQKT
ncbi:MAG: isocitrate/isopropylmalate dehydrogenase family protein [bacterium]|jgi:isocitrate dehydrogenase (NAD+)|nr:isocitrate/isopropylmalate dehydrogenase family protein [Bacillota bacterium]